jgi:hypothetical protein
MLRRLAPLLLALPALMASTITFAKPQHCAQRTIQPRPAVHYYHAKPPRAVLT